MARSRAARKRGGGGRLQTVGIFLTILLAGALLGSLVAGLLDDPQPDPRQPARPRVAAPAERVRVEVLNASGRAGLAREATGVLRDGGFDVVSFGNASGFAPDSSLVLDRVGRLELARQAADALGIRRVLARPDSNLYLDVTVVLGRDWRPDTTEATAPER
ncbi:MAG TPA: LytR C-terminal domain-containing protein [Longimicrobiaceae bacterium]|nr:LytR C-terminal domain-containing protein [Longimicrobiaceae bacterium]